MKFKDHPNTVVAAVIAVMAALLMVIALAGASYDELSKYSWRDTLFTVSSLVGVIATTVALIGFARFYMARRKGDGWKSVAEGAGWLWAAASVVIFVPLVPFPDVLSLQSISLGISFFLPFVILIAPSLVIFPIWAVLAFFMKESSSQV